MRLRSEDLDEVRIFFSHDERDSRLSDTGFLACDILEALTEVLHVIAGDPRDPAGKRQHNVRAVEPPAQPNLDDR
jgi:hypothetical protein